MNELMIFENQEFGIVNVMEINGDVYFEVYSVGMALGQTKESKGKLYPRKERIEENIKNAEIKPVVHNGQLWITESQLYDLMFETHTERVKPFKKWVTNEVLPSIRKNGGYISGQETMSDDELLAKALVVAQNKIAERDKAIGQLKTEINVKDQMIGELKPKADYTDRILHNTGLVTITQIAKDYGMSAQEMNQKLHELGIQFKQSGQWLLYRQFHSMGYTHSETVDITRSDGKADVKMNTKWTQKGRLFLYNKLKGNGILPNYRENRKISAPLVPEIPTERRSQ